MTACTTQPPATSGEVSRSADGKEIRRSTVKIPAEVDPPPPVQPGNEGPGVTTNQPSQPDRPKGT